jgi:inner membrane protein
VDQRRVYYLSGEIQTARIEPVADIDRYRPVIYSGQTMTLRYARAQELGPWLDLVAAKGEVFVQFWLRPGEAAVTLGPGEVREVERIPEQLRRFLSNQW